MASLPKKLEWPMAQDRWASMIEPVLNNPISDSLILKNVSVITGINTINHKLGRKLVGWYVVRKRAIGDLYDTQDTNQYPALTLSLVSSTNNTIDLAVF